MRLEVLSLCDAATEAGGKLNILGAFDRLWAHQVPVVHPHCSVALRIRFDRIEEGPHKFRVTLADEDGHLVIEPLESVLDIRFGPDEVSLPVNLILFIHQLKLHRYGDYAVDVTVDGFHLGSIPLAVRCPPNPGHIPPNPFHPG